MRKLQIISINHQSHTSQERIALNLSSEKWNELFAFMKYVLNIEGYVHLSTFNRIEIYYEASIDYQYEIIEKWILLLDNTNVDGNRFITYSGSLVCVRYLLGLSVGLYSAVPGDDQILAQLKKQFIAASSKGNLSTLLERAFQSIMKSHKQICKRTDYRKQTLSLAYHSLKSITKNITPKDVKNKSLLIIGAGDMAAQVVKYIDKFSFRKVTITNRTINKAENLIRGKSIDIVNYSRLDTSPYDIIISCTDYGYNLITNMERLDYYIDLSIMSTTFTDIAIPHIFLHELQTFIKAENVKRFSSLDLVNEIIEDHVYSFTSWVESWQKRFVTVENI